MANHRPRSQSVLLTHPAALLSPDTGPFTSSASLSHLGESIFPEKMYQWSIHTRQRSILIGHDVRTGPLNQIQYGLQIRVSKIAMSMAHAALCSAGTYGQNPSFALSPGPIATAAVLESVTPLTKAYIGKVVNKKESINLVRSKRPVA